MGPEIVKMLQFLGPYIIDLLDLKWKVLQQQWLMDHGVNVLSVNKFLRWLIVCASHRLQPHTARQNNHNQWSNDNKYPAVFTPGLHQSAAVLSFTISVIFTFSNISTISSDLVTGQQHLHSSDDENVQGRLHEWGSREQVRRAMLGTHHCVLSHGWQFFSRF